MSLDKTLQALKDHLHPLVGEPVFISDPDNHQQGIHIYVYWLSENKAYHLNKMFFCPQVRVKPKTVVW